MCSNFLSAEESLAKRYQGGLFSDCFHSKDNLETRFPPSCGSLLVAVQPGQLAAETVLHFQLSAKETSGHKFWRATSPSKDAGLPRPAGRRTVMDLGV